MLDWSTDLEIVGFESPFQKEKKMDNIGWLSFNFDLEPENLPASHHTESIVEHTEEK